MRLRRVGVTAGTLTRLVAGTTLAVVAATAVGASAAAEHDRSIGHDPGPTAAGRAIAKAHPVSAAKANKVKARYGRLPLAFQANVGQVDRQVRYVAHGTGYTLYLTDAGAVMSLQDSTKPVTTKRVAGRHGARLARVPSPTTGVRQTTVRFRPVGAAAHQQTRATGRLPGSANYFIGKKRSGWHTKVPTFSHVRTASVWPGIDLTWYGKNKGLEYDVTLAPGADASTAQFAVDGAQTLRLDAHKNLLITAGRQTLTEPAPVAWQDVDGVRRPVTVGYRLLGAHTFGFALGKHDATRPVVIDPSIVYSTYLGGGGTDVGVGIAVDATGAAYVTGATTSVSFPTCTGVGTPTAGCTGPSFRSTLVGHQDAFVTKLSPSGNQVLYSTYLGGSGDEDKDTVLQVKGFAAAIAVDSAGNAYVTGSTTSTDFPLQNASQLANGGGASDAYVTVLNPAGNGLVYSTYLGGGGLDEGLGIALAQGCSAPCSAYVTGATKSTAPTPFPTMNPFQSGFGGGASDAFVTKLNSGGAPIYSTYLGGSGDDAGLGIAVDSTGAAYVTGGSTGNFPVCTPVAPPTGCTTASFDTTAGGLDDAFVTKLTPTGSGLVYSTYLGGTDRDEGTGIALQPNCATPCPAYVAGITRSSNFPTTSNPAQLHLGSPGNANAFVTEVNPAGTGLVYSTYLGGTGSGGDEAFGIAVDQQGRAFITGLATSTDFPTSNAFQPHSAGLFDAFVAALNPAGSALVYSSYLGGTGIDFGYGIAVDQQGAAYLTGFTTSSTFPTANPFQAHLGTERSVNAFVTKISPPPTAQHRPAPVVPRERRHHGHCWNNDPNPNTNVGCDGRGR